MSSAAHSVKVYQEGTSSRFTALCDCAWQISTGTMKATRDAAREHIANPDQPIVALAAPSQALAVPTNGTVTGLAAELWDAEQLRILKNDLKIKSDPDLAYFAQKCDHLNLDPFLGEIAPVYYGTQMVTQIAVEGLRTIAERSGLYGGFDGPYWCGPDHVWRDVWLDDGPPAAARYFVRRKDWVDMVPGVARWASCAQFINGKLGSLWASRPDEMLGKTAEVRALKRAFPKVFARAGVASRDLSDAQVVTMQARQAGLDDDARHALVADVTDGRTTSTRDLTDDEMLEARAEIARIRTQRGDVIDVHPEQHPEQPDAVARTIARAAGDLEQRLEQLNDEQIADLKPWRVAQGLARPVGVFDPAERARLAAELDRRGWATPAVATTGAPEVAEHDDAANLDQYSDEPF